MTKQELIQEIARLKKEKNAIVLAHYYSNPDVQDIADFLGDSLELSRKAGTTDADVIVFAGVHFMAETAALISNLASELESPQLTGTSLMRPSALASQLMKGNHVVDTLELSFSWSES